jgi:tRNA (guanosine-2'-O-)-methyltransferase
LKREGEDLFEPGADFSLAEGWSAEGVIRALEPLAGEARRRRLWEVFEQRLDGVTLLMDAPHDPHNGSAVLRSCEAFGLQTVHVVERAEPFLAARRIAKGTEHWVDVVRHASVDAAVSVLRNERYVLVASHPAGELEPADLAGLPRLALILGNEHDGICLALEQAAERSVRIPMRGFVESLNVSVAAAILLAAATAGRAGDIGPERRRWLYARGLVKSVPRARDVLGALKPS